ncbi:MAG TPA: IPT/TIG domain-containing protein [Solirubrobacteraceae bacterium]|nr:IPT/TIG domain-containing protein [Solirubrobacteraceae bacterium]
MRSLRIALWIALVALVVSGAGAVPAFAANDVFGWGENEEGALGNPEAPFEGSLVPMPVSGLGGARAVAAGGEYALALTEEGTVQAWGYNARGELGEGGEGKYFSETPMNVGLSGVKEVAARLQLSLALMEDGTVRAWGDGEGGGLGNGTEPFAQSKPVTVSGLGGVRQIADGGTYGLALLEDGTVMSWGGHSGDDLPAPVAGLSGVRAIAAGGGENLAVLEDGTVDTWSGGGSPEPVPGVTGAVAVSVDGGHDLALLADGTVMAWGYNGYGALGLGDPEWDTHPTPTAVPGLFGVTAIAAGGEFTLALTEGGGVLAAGRWAVNGSRPSSSDTFVPICGLSGASAIGAGGDPYAVAPAQPVCAGIWRLPYRWGPPGTDVTIEGSNLKEVTAVHFGGASASFTLDSPTEITAVAPPGTGEVEVSVSTPLNTTGRPDSFTYVEPPSFGRCSRVAAGPYSNTGCTVAGPVGGHEWEPLSSGTLSIAGAGSLLLQTVTPEDVEGTSITCQSASGGGQVTSDKTLGGIALTLAGCANGRGQECSSAGEPSGDVATATLKATLGIEKLGSTDLANVPGLALEPEGPSDTFLEVTCSGSTPVTVRGSVIAVMQHDVTIKSPHLVFSAVKGRQRPEHLVEGPPDILQSSFRELPFEPIGLTGKLVLTGADLEVNTVV